MLGAIAGDIIGSVYEANPIKTTEFPLFRPGSRPTDDTVLTVALADTILSGTPYQDNLKEYFYRYPDAGYGGTFIQWALSTTREPYNSWGNGSAMRVSPVAFAYSTLEECLEHAERSAKVTHNHPEGIKGAQATAAAILLARTGASKATIKEHIEDNFGYDLSQPLAELREWYSFDVSCQGTVPPALIAFLASEDFEDAVRKAISLGGDSDTLACIAGGIAQAFYGGVPEHIKAKGFESLEDGLIQVVEEFCRRVGCG